MQTFARKLNLIALALGAALTAPGCATDWFSSSSSDYVAGELSQDVENLPDPNAPPTPPKRSTIVSPLGAAFKESPDRLLLQANAYFEQGKFHDSARLYQKYLATPEAATAPPPVLGQAHYRIAVVARKKMNFAEAKREFETALRYEPQNQLYRFELGKSAFDGADYATADAAFSALIAQNPNYPQAQYYYGLTLLEGTRRAEAIAPLTKAVGELEAAALLTDKYYALCETANAAAWEAQTTQIAARLGRPVPALPNKPAFASTVQPQTPPQVALIPQPQAPAQVAPATQPQVPTQVAPATQPQVPAQVAPATQPQVPAQVAPAPQPQVPAQVAPATQPQAPAQVAPTAQPQTSAQAAPTAQPQTSVQAAPSAQPQAQVQVAPTAQPQAQVQVAPTAQPQTVLTAQLQGPAPFVATPAPTIEEVAPSIEPLENANDDAKSQSLAVAPLENATPEDAAPSTSLVDQNAENAKTLTAHIGRRNPGLFAAPTNVESATPAAIGFRPGSISTTATATPQETQVAQNAPFVGPQLPKSSRFDAETAFRRVERLVELENCVAEYFAPLAPIYETAPSPFQIAQPEELYAAAPSPSDLANDADAENEEFDENDDFAFASSGATPTAQTAVPEAAVGGFGSYQAPTFDATPLAPQNVPIAQIPQNALPTQTPLAPQYAQTPQPPFVSQSALPTQTTLTPQNVPIAQIPQNALPTQTPLAPQYAQTTQTPFAPQNALPTQTPFIPQSAPVASTQVAPSAPTATSRYAAPNAVPRRRATPEERLQAAIAAGAEVREISPEEYRRAVSVGMSGQTQPR